MRTKQIMAAALILIGIAGSAYYVAGYNQERQEQAAQVDRIMAVYNAPNQARIKECIMKYAPSYGHEPWEVAAIIGVESSYNRTATNWARARGLGQIRPCWDHLLYLVDGGRLGAHLLTLSNVDHDKYWFRIGYNIEGICMILNYYKRKMPTDSLAWMSYNNGQNSKIVRTALYDCRVILTNRYVRKIYALQR